MMLTEVTTLPDAALPVPMLKDHLRLGSGFADDTLQDGLLAQHLRAALAVIEGRTAKVLIARRFSLRLQRWRDLQAQALPLAPVTGVLSVTLVDGGGEAVVLEPARYRLVADMHRPRLAAAGVLLPQVPEGGHAEVVFEAGFGPWAMVPADLAQAVLLLAAEFYEHRHDGARTAGLPFAVVGLIERWRTVRVLGGGAA